MLQILLPPETEAALRKRASIRGEDVAIYAGCLLQDAVDAPDVDEMLRPFRRQVADEGTPDEELDALCDELRGDLWKEHQGKKAMGA
jgi:hypothetical protein